MTTFPSVMEENGTTYRLLQVRESLEKGDQALDIRRDTWSEVGPLHYGCVITDPDKNLGYPQGYYRRAVNLDI